MNIFKFLLIDTVLAIAVIPLLFLLKDSNKKFSFFRSSNKEKILENAYDYFPNKESLLNQEKLAIRAGTGIKFNSLIGNWKFISVWEKDTDNEDSIFSSLLRFFSANLELKKDISPENSMGFLISASIKFGLFSIKFSGSASLKGKQPFLFFCFNLIEFKSGSSVLFRRSIKQAIEKEKLFFALISLEKSDRYLSARGQGGAIVLWLKE